MEIRRLSFSRLWCPYNLINSLLLTSRQAYWNHVLAEQEAVYSSATSILHCACCSMKHACNAFVCICNITQNSSSASTHNHIGRISTAHVFPCILNSTQLAAWRIMSPAATPSSWAGYISLRSLHADVLLRTAKLCAICARILPCINANLRVWLLTHSSKAFSFETHQTAQPCGSRT